MSVLYKFKNTMTEGREKSLNNQGLSFFPLIWILENMFLKLHDVHLLKALWSKHSLSNSYFLRGN